MSGKITFHFDDGFLSHYTKVFPLFKKHGAVGCLALSAIFRPENAMSNAQVKEMMNSGWEIMSHGTLHRMLNEYNRQIGIDEIVNSKKELLKQGFDTKQFMTPCSECNFEYLQILRENYDSAFTVYTNSSELPIERLVIKRPVDFYKLNRACLTGKTFEELKQYVDYVSQNDVWLNLCDHDIGVDKNITADKLNTLLGYCKEKSVAIMTVAEAIYDEKNSQV